MVCFVAETYSHMVEGRLDISRLKSALFCLFSLFDVSWCKHFVSFILSSGFDSFPFKSLCSYAMPFPIGNHSVVSAQWKPLGKVGSFHVPAGLIDGCVDFGCIPKPPKGVCVPKPCVANQALLAMCVDLSNLGVISCLDGLSCPPCPTMNLSLRPKPNNPSKYLLICDLRAMIQRQRCAPLKFTLPSLESLFALQGDISFCTIDIANAYHSCVLPESVASAFVFALLLPSGAVSTFRWNRLPFGWDRSPVIFSKIMSSVLPPVVSSVGKVSDSARLAFFDDIICAAPESALVSLRDSSVRAIEANDFVVSNKSVLSPSKSVQWLGKQVSSSEGKVFVSPKPNTDFVLAFALIFCFALSFPFRFVRSLSGLFCWSGLHHRLHLPFLQQLHQAAVFKHSVLHVPALLQCIKAIKLCQLSSCCLPFSMSRPACLIKDFVTFACLRSALTAPLIFVDACADLGKIGCILISAKFCLVWSVSLPSAFHSAKFQQFAELYAIKFAISKVVSLFPDLSDLFLVSDSTSAIATFMKFSVKARHTRRGKVLRQVASLISKSPFRCSFGFVRSKMNPADLPSRSSDSGCFDLSPDVSALCLHSLSHILWDKSLLHCPPSLPV